MAHRKWNDLGKAEKLQGSIGLALLLAGAIFIVPRCFAGDSEDDAKQAVADDQVALKERLALETPERDAERDATINKWTKQGVFTRVVYDDGGVTVFVGPKFHVQTYEEKLRTLNVVLTASMRRNFEADLVRVQDPRTGKAIGSLTKDGATF